LVVLTGNYEDSYPKSDKGKSKHAGDVVSK